MIKKDLLSDCPDSLSEFRPAISFSPLSMLLIAPYPGLKLLFEEVCSQYTSLILDAYISDTEDAASFIQSLPLEHYDLIISRGQTCKILEKACGRHILDVGISIYDVFRAIRLAQNYNGKFAVVGFKSVIYYAIVLKDILRYEMDVFTIDDIHTLTQNLNDLKAQGYTMIVGDVVTTTAAKLIGLQSILITTSRESVVNILENTLSLYSEQLSLKRELELYKEIIKKNTDEIILFSTNGDFIFSSSVIPKERLSKIIPSLKRLVYIIIKKGESRFVKTIDNMRFFIRGTLFQTSTQTLILFFLHEAEQTAQTLIKYHNFEDVEKLSQRTFYTLNPEIRSAISSIQSFRLFSSPIIIAGERGTGKDAFAYSIYHSKGGSNKPMVTIDCRCKDEKAWNYLFTNDNSPLFDNGFVLYFREVQNLNSQRQDQILSMIHDSGIDHRNQLLFSYIPEYSDEFCRGPLYRELIGLLRAFVVTIPSLNQCREDIPNLATLYLSEFNAEMSCQAIAIEPEAMQVLQEFDWSDNLYQLRDVIQELIPKARFSFITKAETEEVLKNSYVKYHGARTPSNMPAVCLDGTLDEITKRVINAVLLEEKGNQSKAAKRLGIGRSTLRRHLIP